MNGYVFLGLAILLEIFSTSMLKASDGFTKMLPSFVFAAGMGLSFYAFSKISHCLHCLHCFHCFHCLH